MKCSRSGGRGSQALQSSSGVATMFFQVCIFSYLIAGFFFEEGWKTKSLLWVWCNVFYLSSSPTELDKEVWRSPVLFLQRPLISEAFKAFMKLKSSKVVLNSHLNLPFCSHSLIQTSNQTPTSIDTSAPDPNRTTGTVFWLIGAELWKKRQMLNQCRSLWSAETRN